MTSGQYQRNTRRKEGRARLPQWWLDQPPRIRGDELWFDAYSRLLTCRRYEGGPIPWIDALNYARAMGFGPDSTHFADTMLAMRGHLQILRQQKREEAEKIAAKRAKRKARRAGGKPQ